MNTSCNAVVRGQKQDIHIATNTSRISQPLADQALLALWDHLFALYEACDTEAVSRHVGSLAVQHAGAAQRHGVVLFDPTCALGNFRWSHVSTIRFHSAPSPTTFIFAVEFLNDDGTPLLFTVTQDGNAFRVQDAPVSMA